MKMCDRHPPFDHRKHGDRALYHHAWALAMAIERAPTRGRQTVRRHVGLVFPRGVWFVQDVREAPETRVDVSALEPGLVAR